MRDEFRASVPAFHWMLEFPEVFHGKRPDPLVAERVNKAAWMDAFVGNPPFLGGRRMQSELGDGYVTWLETFYGGSLNADYCAHFFRRTFHLLGEHGTLGLIVMLSQCHVAGTPAPSFVGLYEWCPNCTTPCENPTSGTSRSM